jgi:hypothetical protein
VLIDELFSWSPIPRLAIPICIFRWQEADCRFRALCEHNGGQAVAQLVQALCYETEGAGSIPDEVITFFNLSNPSSRTMALGLTQPLTEMSTRNPYRG